MGREELLTYSFAVHSAHMVSRCHLFLFKSRNYLFRVFIANYAHAANFMSSTMRQKIALLLLLARPWLFRACMYWNIIALAPAFIWCWLHHSHVNPGFQWLPPRLLLAHGWWAQIQVLPRIRRLMRTTLCFLVILNLLFRISVN